MIRFPGEATEKTTGRPIAGAIVSVYDRNGVSVAITDDFGAPIATLKTNAFGLYAFNVATADQYRIVYTLGGKEIFAEDVIIGIPAQFKGDKGDSGINGGVGSSAGFAALFAAANGMAVGTGITMFRFSGHSTAGKGACDAIYDAAVDAAYVAAYPRAAFLAADGRGFRKHASDGFTPEQFGAVGDNSSNDGPIILEILAYIDHLRTALTNTYYSGCLKLKLGLATYYMGTSMLDRPKFTVIEGLGGGWSGGHSSALRWAPNVHGIRTQRYNTTGTTTITDPAQYHEGADGSIFRGFAMLGGYTNQASEGEYHAFYPRTRVIIEDVLIQGWQGDGLYVDASGGGGGATEGNCNGTIVNRVRIQQCRDGVSIRGADSNACTFLLDIATCRRWNINDECFLGNTWEGQSADAGFDVSITPIVSSYGGFRYYVIEGQEAWCELNSPSGDSTSNQGWGFIVAGGPLELNGFPGPIPLWRSGLTFRAGGNVRCTVINGTSLFKNFYQEGGSAPARLSQGAYFDGSPNDFDSFVGQGAVTRPFNGVLASRTPIGSVTRDSLYQSWMGNGRDADHMHFVAPTYPFGYGLQNQSGRLVFTYNGSGSAANMAFEILVPGTTNPLGPHKMLFLAGYGIGSAGVGTFSGTGSPEGALSAVKGSAYHREDGGAGTSFYVKESGTGNTGWVAK